MIDLQTKLYTVIASVPFVIAIKPKAKYRFSAADIFVQFQKQNSFMQNAA
jgi:hypothetical protein